MQKYIDMLSNKLRLMDQIIEDNTIIFDVESTIVSPICSYCGEPSNRKHSYYQKSFMDIPLNNKKVLIRIDTSVNMSSVSAQNLLRKNGVKISKSTICNFLKKGDNNVDISSIEFIGIDDFAIKKRHKYATVMVNQANHRIISAIDSRKITDIQIWLKQYTNLKVVSRDGSNIYKLAIELANPDIIQVSDRFHLIKGLSEAIREEIKKICRN